MHASVRILLRSASQVNPNAICPETMVVAHNIHEEVHDEILVRLDEPLQHHLEEELHQVIGRSGGNTTSTGRRPGESTPLVLKAGDATIDVDSSIDLAALNRKFHEEELQAFLDDQAAVALDVVRDEVVSSVKIALPMTASVLLEMFAGVALNMLLGNVSSDQSTTIIAGSSLCDLTVAEVSLTLIIGLRYAVDTMCAQSIGAKQYTQLWLYAQAGVLAMAYCLPIIVLTQVNGASILTYLGQDPALASLASTFLRINLLSVPFTMSLTIMTCVLTAQGITVPFTITSLSSYAVTLPLAYVLGYKTSLGYLGIPIAIVVNMVLQNLMIGSVLVNNSVFLESWPGWQLAKAHTLLKKVLPLGFASIIMVYFQNVGFDIVSFLCGLLPDAAISISSSTIAINWVSLWYMPLTGFVVAGAVRVGTALGAGHPRRALIACRVTLATSVLTSLLATALCAVFADTFAHAYTTDQVTAKAAIDVIHTMLPIISLTACSLTASAIFRACGKQMFSAKLNIATMLVVGIPVGYLLAFTWSWGVSGLWSGQIVGFVLFTIAAEVWVVRQDWQQLAHAARLNAHVHVDKVAHEPASEPRAASDA